MVLPLWLAVLEESEAEKFPFSKASGLRVDAPPDDTLAELVNGTEDAKFDDASAALDV